ncbi:hypothetical protein M011DRAFT_524418 [Sporormia fimetaria CBS 119925]|uniref:Uncharacterized protein n=1 Tax=Sporormia fimetaria CBS 119925 TaxID=1340428 RepID=A0A6A6VGR2_9PLEO|nr:hypothetical protein M011DRAFT_524418 [Sporormia fimetaria CBS 119925]
MGGRFAFAIPGRKSHTTIQRDDDAHSSTSLSSQHQQHQWSPQPHDGPSQSKAQRILGTTSLPFRPTSASRPSSKKQPSLAQAGNYMDITVSDASMGSNHAERSASRANEANRLNVQRPGLSRRASSNVLGNGLHDDVHTGSQGSTTSHRLAPQASNSTMRSYYDPQRSPLSVSQQTSASAVRDMGLRKGKPAVIDSDHVLRPSSRQAADDLKKQNRKSKPARLDLSKLFPKPRTTAPDHHVGALLSPSKFVNSPSALSSSDDYFPRPMTRDPTPNHSRDVSPRPRAKLTKGPNRHQDPSAQRSASTTRFHERNVYDDAKVHVRRPPRGIQHWFDALSDDSDDGVEESRGEPTVVSFPQSQRPVPSQRDPARNPALGKDHHATLRPDTFHHPRRPITKPAASLDANTFAQGPLTSPSQYSLQSQTSLATTKTKESTFSKTNLQNSSVLSMSSSEDEEDNADAYKAPMRDSVGSTDYPGEIIIGKAHAYDIRPPPARRPSASKLSFRSTSTNAATIEVMYTPEPPLHAFPKPYDSRRSSHARQPSVIPENDVPLKATAIRPQSPTTISIRSTRTSVSEPRARTEGHKLMAVTEEEEALLEMMRRKRAAMAKQSFTEGYKTGLSSKDTDKDKDTQSRQRTPEDKKRYRTSGFLLTETPAASPARKPKDEARDDRVASASTSTASPLLLPPPRSRASKHDLKITVSGISSILADSSSCDEASSSRRPSPSSTRSPLDIRKHQLSPPPEFSPLDPFPSPVRTSVATDVSAVSLTTTTHSGPLPSPITPGLRNAEDVKVKVVGSGSEVSCSADGDAEGEEVRLDAGVLGAAAGMKAAPQAEPPSVTLGPVEEEEQSKEETRPVHTRRRTASSGADVAFSPVRAKFARDASVVREEDTPTSVSGSADGLGISVQSTRSPALEPRIPRKSSKRSMPQLSRLNTSSSSLLASADSGSGTASPASYERRGSRRKGNVGTPVGVSPASGIGMPFTARSSTRCSVSEDVLAAWGSLGGWREVSR